MDHLDEAHAHWSEANKFALEGLKSLFLINSGGGIAYLGFIAKDHHLSSCPIVLFMVGTILSSFGLIMGYYSNLYYGNSRYQNEQAGGKVWRKAQALNRAAAWVALFSIACTMGATIGILNSIK